MGKKTPGRVAEALALLYSRDKQVKNDIWGTRKGTGTEKEKGRNQKGEIGNEGRGKGKEKGRGPSSGATRSLCVWVRAYACVYLFFWREAWRL